LIGDGISSIPRGPDSALPCRREKGEDMREAAGLVLASALLLGACVSGGADPQTGPGANSGVVEGSELQSGGVEPDVGPLQGTLLSADVGRSLPQDDREKALQAEYEALEYGRPGVPVSWSGRRAANYGEIVVGSTYEVNRLECREFTHTIWIGGRARVAKGTACRQPDSTWRVLD
jgi:surface antigen